MGLLSGSYFQLTAKQLFETPARTKIFITPLLSYRQYHGFSTESEYLPFGTALPNHSLNRT